MRIAFLSVEVEPFAKVGGLADVAGSLPKALASLGHDVRTLMPAYGMVVNSDTWNARKVLAQFPVNLNPREKVLADLYELEHEGLRVWLVDGDDYFCKVSRSEDVYTPGRDAYLFFAQASLRAFELMGWIPEVVHANDWHTGFAPVFLREKIDWPGTASVFTIHNLAYQGEFGPDTLAAAGLPDRLFTMDRLETWGGVNFLKSGCAYADQVNTVSPTYAQEIQTEEFGCRLHGLMAYLWREGRLRGILNGIDTQRHDPATDPRVPHHFDASNLSGKSKCRASIAQELGLDLEPGSPVFSVISRLSPQKGLGLVADAVPQILALGGSLVVQALGDPGLARRFRDLQGSHPTRIRFVEAFDADLAQRVYAGTDVFLMPSAFEPCGLGQMFAMRFGTVPVVRKTGGLADTVSEGVNGFTFERVEDFLGAVSRAVDAYRDPVCWARLVRSGMGADFGWSQSAARYTEMYKDALVFRKSDRREALAPLGSA